MSMIYSSLGHAISQQRIVNQVYGTSGNYSSGALPFFNHSLNRSYLDDSGNKFSVRATVVRTPEDAVRALSSGKPIIFTSNHHVTVQTSLTYQVAPGGPVVAKGGKVWDPEPNMGWRLLTASDMSNYEAAWAVSVSDSTPDSASIHGPEIVPPNLDLCSGIKKAISSAQSNFQSIKGSRRGSANTWDTSLAVTGFPDCHLIDYVEDGNLALRCSDPGGSYSEAKRLLETCLSNWNEIANWTDMVQFKTDSAKTMVTLNTSEKGLTIQVEK
jgi:hypothetical protein